MDKSEQIVIPAAHYKCIQSNAHQCGILTRASRILMQSKTEEQAESVILGSMADLQLSGCLIVKVGQNRSINKFGRDLGEGTYRRLLELGVEVEKVHACDDFIVIRTPGMHLLVALEEDDPVLRDLMQDNLAIFADTFQAWLDSHHDELRNKEQALHD